MPKFLKVLGILLGVVVLLMAGYLGYFFSKFPDAGEAENITIERTPARIARGEYLANHVTVCMDCHSTRDWRYFSGPVEPGTAGKGGERFDESMGFPGKIYSPNITPAAIGSMSDGELVRTIGGGVGKDGRALFPLMPYPAYAHLSREDLYSLVAYIRSLTPITNDVPETHLNFPLSIIVRSIPAPFTPEPEPNRNNTYEYGKYLTNAAGCIECHSPAEKGQIIPGKEYSGGREFTFPNGTARSINLTPDEETGIGLWTKEIFVSKFREFAGVDSSNLSLDRYGRQTVMPWTMYAGMTEEDLGAIYDYLRTVPPIQNAVEHWTGK